MRRPERLTLGFVGLGISAGTFLLGLAQHDDFYRESLPKCTENMASWDANCAAETADNIEQNAINLAESYPLAILGGLGLIAAGRDIQTEIVARISARKYVKALVKATNDVDECDVHKMSDVGINIRALCIYEQTGLRETVDEIIQSQAGEHWRQTKPSTLKEL